MATQQRHTEGAPEGRRSLLQDRLTMPTIHPTLARLELLEESERALMDSLSRDAEFRGKAIEIMLHVSDKDLHIAAGLEIYDPESNRSRSILETALSMTDASVLKELALTLLDTSAICEMVLNTHCDDEFLEETGYLSLLLFPTCAVLSVVSPIAWLENHLEKGTLNTARSSAFCTLLLEPVTSNHDWAAQAGHAMTALEAWKARRLRGKSDPRDLGITIEYPGQLQVLEFQKRTGGVWNA